MRAFWVFCENKRRCLVSFEFDGSSVTFQVLFVVGRREDVLQWVLIVVFFGICCSV